MKIGSLCSGYGGLDMAVHEVLGGELAWVADLDPGAAAILAHRFPSVPNLGDITAVDWAAVEPVDILGGGYPCQPFSDAGLRKGTEDERHIWPYIACAIRVLRPRFVVLENVRGHLGRGFDTVLADLADLGFDAEWCTATASEVGAPHRRERLFVLAWPAPDSDRAARGERRLTASGEAARGRSRADASRRGRAPASHAKGYGRNTRRPEPAGVVGGPDAALSGDGTPADADGRGRGPDEHEDASRQPDADRGTPADAERNELARELRTGRGPLGRTTAAGDSEADRGGAAPTDTASSGREACGDHPERARAGSGQGSAACTASPAVVGCGTPADADGGGLTELAERDSGALAGVDGAFGDDALRRVLDWGPYGPAIARWEAVIGRPAPRPTEPGRTGERLSPRFVEFLMGLPEGWVTDVPGLSRNAMLKALGNGVVPQQAELALRLLLGRAGFAEAGEAA